VSVVGGALALSGHISFGVIVAFMIYIRLFTQPLGNLAQAATSLQSTAAASERVFEFLGEEELADESHKAALLTQVRGDVEFDDVQFGYVADKPIIHHFSAQAKAGQKVAIVGPTGAGKTTIVNLLMRFYELNGGDIRIDGVSIQDLRRDQVHALFCMVLQDTWLFEGTIKANLIYSKQGVTDEQVVAACKAVGIDHFIRTLPQGYDTVLDDKANLSTGQKQLLTIARAVIEDAPLLILDEATSSIDTRTEVLIQKAMDQLMEGRTSFVIAHRLSTIKNADLILVMKDGDIIESGTHDELLAKQGFYGQLYNSQFEQVG
jgi:ATP-binding cassette subfamily B protein